MVVNVTGNFLGLWYSNNIHVKGQGLCFLKMFCCQVGWHQHTTHCHPQCQDRAGGWHYCAGKYQLLIGWYFLISLASDLLIFPLTCFWLANTSSNLPLIGQYCQAKVQVQSQVQKSSPKSEVLSLESRTWTLLTVLSLLHHPPTTTTLNFLDTSRGPTTKCYTFLETSHNPWLRS